MIPAGGDHFASYTENGKHRSRKVIAWNDDGHAMVAGRAGLVPAHTLPGFETLYEKGDERVLTALPGGGWMVDWKNDGDDEWTTTPVLLWAVHADGTASPMDADHYGETGNAMSADRCYLYHPDHDRPEHRTAFGARPGRPIPPPESL